MVEDAAASDGRELVPVADERDPRSGLVGDRQERAGGVLVEHPRLVDQQQVTRSKSGGGSGVGVGSPGPVPVVVPAPAVLVDQPGGGVPSAPVSAAATSAAFNVGVTTTSRCPCRASSS